MKIVERITVLEVDKFSTSYDWAKVSDDVETAVQMTDWPHGSGLFTIYPESGKKAGEGNGVKPIKSPCMKRLRELGWQTEKLPVMENSVLDTGDLDAVYYARSGCIGFEWETGNISSSHRAINKLLLTMKLGGLVGGFLVVPSDKLKVFLTDRIGNIGELRHYFPLWSDTKIRCGALQVIVVEHDAESVLVPRIPKGKDGLASVYR